MPIFVRQRVLPIAAALAISTAAVAYMILDAKAQEAPKPAASTGTAGAPAAATTTPPPAAVPAAQAAPVAKDPALPEVKIIQEPKPAPVQEAAPKPKPKPAPFVEVEDPAPKPKKKTVVKEEAEPKPLVKKAVKVKPAPKPLQQAEPAPSVAPAPATEPALVNATGTYNPALDLDGVDLPPGTTITTAGPVNGYRALSAMSSTKTATPLERLPQSIQVVPEKIIKDQTSLTVNETVRNASNVQSFNDLNIGNTDMAGSKIRGFKAEQWLDGLVVNYNTGDRDAFANVERIEVLKGPSAILYGGGSGAPVGGAISVISKLPTDKVGGAFGITFGSNSYARPYFDINQPISADGTVLFRVTGEYTSADSFVDVLEQDRYSFNPTLTLTNKTDTTLTIQARKSKFEQQAYPGLPVFGTVAGDFGIDRHLYLGDPNIPRSYSEVEGVTVTLDHKVDDVWSFNVKSRWSRSEFDQFSQAPFSGVPDGFFGLTNFQLIEVDMFQQQQEFTINPNVQAKFNAGPTRNVVLVGADYSRSTDRGYMNTDFLGYFSGLLPEVDVLNPVFATPYIDPRLSPFFFPFFDFETVYKTKGVYGQVQTTLFDSIHVLGGLRWANIDVEYLENTLAATFTVDEGKVLPRAGIVVDIFDGLSVYASYSEGMRWGGFNQAIEVKPEFSEQREAGVKFDFNNQLSGTLAVFDIERSNIPTAAGGFVTALTDQRARGFEADMIYQPDRNWQILANYGYVDAEYTSGIRSGNTLIEVPAHSGRVWANYKFEPDVLKGWSVGAGVYASTCGFVDPANQFKTAGYFTVDAKIGYENENFAASLNVKNLTGEEYFVPYAWFEGQVAPGADRAFYGTIAYKY